MSWLSQRARSFIYAFRGIGKLYKHTPNALIHLAFTIGVVVAGFLFKISLSEWFTIILCIGAVTAAEAINSSIESLADKISTEKDPLIGNAKDLAAGAVLILAICSAIIGLLIFIPKIF